MKRKKFFLVFVLIMFFYPFPVIGKATSEQKLNESQYEIEHQESVKPLVEEDQKKVEVSGQSVNTSDNYEGYEDQEMISPIYRVHNQAYGSFDETFFPYNSTMELNIPIYDYSQKSQYLPRVYIIIPKETKLLGGLSSLQAKLEQYLMLNNNIKGGQLIASKLSNSPNGREVYQVTPTEGTYISGILQEKNLHLTLEAPDKNNNIEKVILNANKNSEIADYNILFFGYDKNNLTNVNGRNPVVNAKDCGIEGSNLQVATSVSSQNRQEVYFYIQKIKDSYKLMNQFTGDLIGEKSIVGDFGDTYSRVGFIDTLEAWGLDVKKYSEDSLILESGEINGSEIFTTEDRNSEEIVEGENYSLFVKKYAGDIEVSFVDSENQNIIVQKILSGYVGQEYFTQAEELQGWALETGFPENQNGLFTEETQAITYRYVRKEGEPVVVKYVDENNNNLAEEEIFYGKIGLEYQTQEKRIKGWEIKERPINAVGKFMDIPQEVIYVYTAKSLLEKEDLKSEEKHTEKTNTILPRTGEKYTFRVRITQIGSLFVFASVFIYFRRLKYKEI